ncbi:unnamed protein product [Strongylus vulgaris]|uniref:Uncharacterized protein n=1 Tax=Strongylus vulgaris TaxID=40348 RepID=A0A3P7K3R6_STRVU|nr:unnamed protein product [Strongylus vulgaris]
MDAIVAVCDLYRRDLNEAVASLRQRGLLSSGRSSRSRIRSLRSTRTASDRMFPSSRNSRQERLSRSCIQTEHKTIVEVFLWGAVLTFSSHIGSLFGSCIASPLLYAIFDKLGASIFAFLVLPLFTKLMLRKHQRKGVRDAAIRFMLLITAVLQGLVSGFVIDSTYISGEPLAFVTPLAIVMAYMGEINSVYKNRLAMLTACTTAGLIANFVIGILLNALTKTYELMTFAYVTAGMLTLQNVQRNVEKAV